MTSKPLPQEVSYSGVKDCGPCFEMVSTNGSNDLSFQNSSGVALQGSRHDFVQLRDAYSSPIFASFLNSSSSISGSKLVQNLQLVVSNKNAEYDSSTAHIVSYGPIYRLLKPHGASSFSTIAPSASFKHPVSSSVTSKPVPTSQNGYKAGFSQIGYDGMQLGNTYNAVTSTYYSRNKPTLSNMVVSSGPIITLVMPNQTNDQLVQTINKTQSSYEPGAPIKPLVTLDQPTVETSKPSEHSQGMNHQRPTSHPQVSNEETGIFQTLKPILAPKHHLPSKDQSTPQSRIEEPRFTQLGNAYSSDTTYKSSSVFKPAQTIYMQQTAKPVQSSQSGFSQDVVYDSSSTAVPLSGSVYRFSRPGYVYGTSASTGTSMYVPSSSTKTGQSDYLQHFYQAGLTFPKVGYHSTSSAVASGDSKYGFVQSGNVYGLTDNVYTSNSQSTVGSSNLSRNPYFISKQGQSSYSTFTPLQPNYKSLPTRYMQMPSKHFSTPFSQKVSVLKHLNQMRNQMSNVHAVTSEGFQNLHHHGSLLNSDPVSSGYVVDQTSNQQGILVKPSQQFFRPLSSLSSPESQPVSSRSWYGPSQPDSGFVLRGSRPVLNF